MLDSLVPDAEDEAVVLLDEEVSEALVLEDGVALPLVPEEELVPDDEAVPLPLVLEDSLPVPDVELAVPLGPEELDRLVLDEGHEEPVVLLALEVELDVLDVEEPAVVDEEVLLPLLLALLVLPALELVPLALDVLEDGLSVPLDEDEEDVPLALVLEELQDPDGDGVAVGSR